jgi:WD40 repeat protein
VVDAPSECAWFFARHQVHRISLGKQPRTQHVAVPGLESTNGLIAPLVMKNGRLVIGLPESPQLYFVNDSLKIDCIQPNFGCRRGYSVVCPFGDRLLCGLLDSVAIRLIDETGIEANAFVGHADTPKFLSPISKDCFVSAGDDRAVNLWDVRESVPITHIDLAPRDILGVCGCETCVVFSLDDKTICSVDIRALPNRPMLGLSLDDYHASSIYYDDHSNSLRLFGAASISGDSNSLLFLNDGINRKYILRQYHNFFPGI